MVKKKANLFWTQLRTLLWKNAKLKSRGKVFLVMEILWPLVLFAIIVLVRLIKPALDKPACHLQPKALMSAGMLPFVQTFMCSLDNQCMTYPPEADAGSQPPLNRFIDSASLLLADQQFEDDIRWLIDSGVGDLLTPGGIVDVTVGSGTLEQSSIDALSEATLNVGALTDLSASPGMAATWVTLLVSSFQVCDSSGQLSPLIIFPDQFDRDQVAADVCSNLDATQQNTLFAPLNDVVDYILGETLSLDNLQTVLRINNKIQESGIIESSTDLFTVVQGVWDSQQTGLNLAPLGNVLCGGAFATDMVVLGDDSFEELADYVGLSLDSTYVENPDLSPICNSLFAQIEGDVILSNLWSYVKPYVVGKIFYAPDTIATQKIIQETNKTFDDVATLLNLANQIENSRYELYRELYEYFEFENPVDQLPILTLGIDALTAFAGPNDFVDNETVGQFFSNDPPAGMNNWATVFNASMDLLAMVNNYSSCIELNRFQGFDTEAELVEAGMPLMSDKMLWAGFVFTDIDEGSPDVPKHVKYKIRMPAGVVDDTDAIIDRTWFPDPRTNPLFDLKPVISGQVYLMDILEKAVIKLHAGEAYQSTGTWIKQFPSPCYREDRFLYAISRTIPLFMVLAWLFSVGMIVKSIVYEKETRLKEVMKVMGLGNTIHWISWFITTLVVLFIAAIMLAALLKFGTVLGRSDFGVILFMFISFIFPTITFCFLVSTFFSNANLASASAGILFFCAYLPYTLYISWERYVTSNLIKYLLCLSSNVAFGFACSYFAYFEQQGTGLLWENLNESPNYKDDFSFLKVIMMMYIDGIIYLLLALYIEQVFPGKYGVPKPAYFFLTKSFWMDGSSSRSGGEHFDPEFKVLGDKFEEEPEDLEIGVQIKNMTKVYSTGNKLAVDGLSMNFYKNQITSFLGHNGAGKTTTLSILTGLFAPSEGTAFVDGKDIRTHMDEIRRSIGMCPQYNVLFGELTVKEHLWFYARLRGRAPEEIASLSMKLLDDLNLQHKLNERSSNLSGGMKRKLSVGISFIGDNKTVILDEPTAGVDPHSRRGIWELLTKYKEGRTIILSTHHMDEADILGNRIAIISNGSLQTCGSSIYLRKEFGDGYILTVVRDKRQGADLNRSSDSYDPALDGPYTETFRDDVFTRDSETVITDFIESHVPGAELTRNMGSELSYNLPYSALEKGAFQTLFDSLATHGSSLGISDYGLSDTSLEDIFIKVADRAPDADNTIAKKRSFKTRLFPFLSKAGLMKNAPVEDDDEVKETVAVDMANGDPEVSFRNGGLVNTSEFSTLNVPKVTGVRLGLLQFCALFLKRVHHIRKDGKAFFSQILLPAAFVLLAMIFTLIVPGIYEQPALELQPWMYGDKMWAFFSDSSGGDPISLRMKEAVVNFPHHSTRCMEGYSIKNTQCERGNIDNLFNNPGTPPQLSVYDVNSEDPSPTCNCGTGVPKCSAAAGGGTPPRKILATTDQLQNLTSRNISDYLLKTRLDYRLQRFYGFEFEGERNDAGLSENALIQATLFLEEIIQDNTNFSLFNTLPDNELVDFSTMSWSDLVTEANEVVANMGSQQNVKLWWNNKAHHGLISSVNALHNSILRSYLPDSTADKDAYGITAISHPWKMTEEQILDEVMLQGARDVVVSICVIFAMSFVPGSFVLYLIYERTSKSKHLQYVSGVNPSIYWLSTLAWDLTNYMVPAILCIFIFLAFQTKSYVSADNFPCLCLLLILYGWGITPLMYPASYIFDVPSTAYVLLTGINAFIGINATVATFVLDLFRDDEELTAVNNVLKKIFLIFPQYCLGRGLLDMAQNQIMADTFSAFGSYKFESPLRFELVGRNLLCMFVQGIVFMGILLLLEHVYVFRRLFIKPKSETDAYKAYGDDDEQEEDVKAEADRIRSGCSDADPVVVKNLRKTYSSFSRKIHAVRGVTFSVPRGECFGLLGVNGAGKTTTFNMLTGDSIPSRGSAEIAGFNVVTQLNSSRKKVGFCPQFDALDQLLTVKEHLELYARLRGIENKNITSVVNMVIAKMGLKKYTDKQAGTLSGGNKRKLSTAIALIGDPQIIFLDEPTSGMDPKARRYLWKCIQDAIEEGRSVVLTSHSMEECEALCTRLAIMVNGQFKCLGSTQHIKTKYGNGYVVQIKCSADNNEELEEYFLRHFPNAERTEKLPTMLGFQIPQEDASLSMLFRVLEDGKRAPECLVEDCSVGQTTLDQVFINFASEQSEDTTAAPVKKRKRVANMYQEVPANGAPDSNPRMQVNGVAAVSRDSRPPSYRSSDGGRGKDMKSNANLLDNMSITSADSSRPSTASAGQVDMRPSSANSMCSFPPPIDDVEPLVAVSRHNLPAAPQPSADDPRLGDLPPISGVGIPPLPRYSSPTPDDDDDEDDELVAVTNTRADVIGMYDGIGTAEDNEVVDINDSSTSDLMRHDSLRH
jgi:ATP-binding cassette subfamily A (ABC1) protein 1